MKPALPLSFGAALCCHALVLFAFELRSAPSVVSTDAGASSVGVELLGASEGDAAAALAEMPPHEEPEPLAEEPPSPVPEPPEPMPIPPPESTPAPETLPEPEAPVPDAEPTPPPSAPTPSAPTKPAATPATSKPSARAASSPAANKVPGGKAAGGGARGGLGATGMGWDTEARPAYRHNPPPAYPPAALRARRQGTVIVRVEVSAEGRALDVRLCSGSGFADLDAAALQAVRRWRFEPARLAGAPVPSRVDVPVAFNLMR